MNPGALLSEGATQLGNVVGPQYLDALKIAYNDSITEVCISVLLLTYFTDTTQTLYVCVATGALSIFGSALIPWLSIKKKKEPAPEQQKVDSGIEKEDANERV